ncbi:UDP-3-O-[3-hydroxymyristoyl] glucosamine N-acyltransferase [Phycisphaera mikurensis NBRC 102666]|uniref:UDP-3-O-acylglucosamine N-acyltransferase n=1 Tax=Phycisphaera mikurensis (strain NBRC 102666 / KCTC 22515 / FYK2301M01) TaxID=1142394 RepID=I0IC86_PHYMF|nr:UDP-3-O-[3-hydroxymyristoyl] glucosamine N-acyltransferase [Phycisphaera mikurensis NBRC 102666]
MGGELESGDADARITALAMLHEAEPTDLSFVAVQAWAGRYAASRAGVVMASRGVQLPPRADGHHAPVIRVADADLGMARLLEAITPADEAPAAGVHAQALVDPTADVGDGVSIGPGCTVGPRVRLGDGCVLHAGSHVYADAVIGPGGTLWPGVVIRERTRIGARFLAHANVVIGGDGFGFRGDAGDDGRPIIRKVPHLGNVVIGDDVELGACTCVDKGKFGSTRIGNQTKIDNHVQVGHNVVIGDLVVISGCCAIAGSCVIGDGVMVGGATAFADHVTIGPGTKLAGGSQVMADVPAGVEWGGIPAQHFKDRIRQEVAVRKLPDLLKRLKRSGLEL